MAFNIKEYHPKWTLIVRLIRKRSGNRCEGSPRFPDCRAENYKPHPVTGNKVTLTVAHMDHIKEHNNFDNLRHLCNRCHLVHDINQHTENRKYGRHWKRNQIKMPI